MNASSNSLKKTKNAEKAKKKRLNTWIIIWRFYQEAEVTITLLEQFLKFLLITLKKKYDWPEL